MTPRQLTALQTLKKAGTSLRNSGNPVVADACGFVSRAVASFESGSEVLPERTRKAVVAIQGCGGLKDKTKRKLIEALSLLLT